MHPKVLHLTLFLLSLMLLTTARAQCPAFGNDTTCGTIITITPTNGVTITQTGQGPYDGNDDTLVGIVNNSNVPISSIVLTSSQDIFGFDGDGVDDYGAPGNPKDNTGYGGPNTYFTSYGGTTGTVNFITPLAPKGGSTYFSLENALSSTPPCSDIVKNGVAPAVINGTSNSTITTKFTPNYNYSLAQAATFCGFVDFDWMQTIVNLPDPSPFTAKNLAFPASSGYVNGTLIPTRLGGAFRSGGPVPYPLKGSDAPFNDPPQGGGYTYTSTLDYSYPFYCDVLGDPACAKTYYTISFTDTPADPCLPDGAGNASPAYKLNPSVQALCGNAVAPAGSAIAFTTHLAGVQANGTAKDLGLGVAWKSNFNGTSGGTATTKNTRAADAGSGNGGVTVVNTSETTNYQYTGFGVTAINGAAPAPQTLLSSTQVAVTASGLAYSRLTKAFTGTVTITNVSGQDIAGPLEVVLNFVTAGITVNGSSGTFGGFPYITLPSTLAAGASTTVPVSFSNPAGTTVNFNPVVYSGSFQ